MVNGPSGCNTVCGCGRTACAGAVLGNCKQKRLIVRIVKRNRFVVPECLFIWMVLHGVAGNAGRLNILFRLHGEELLGPGCCFRQPSQRVICSKNSYHVPADTYHRYLVSGIQRIAAGFSNVECCVTISF